MSCTHLRADSMVFSAVSVGSIHNIDGLGGLSVGVKPTGLVSLMDVLARLEGVLFVLEDSSRIISLPNANLCSCVVIQVGTKY